MSDFNMDNITTQLGVLIGQSALMQKSIDNLSQKQNETTVICTTLKNDINSVHSRIDALIKDINPTIEYANDWNETKKKAKYGIFGIALTGIVSGTFIGATLEKIGTILK